LLLFLLTYPIIGAGIKYMDAAFDDETVSKRLAIWVAPILGLITCYSMIINPVSATILMAIILGVLLTGKIDNRAHILCLAIIISILIYVGVEFLIIPLIMLVLAGMFDEIGNDIIDKKKEHIKEMMGGGLLIKFFEQRWALKIAVLGFVFFGLFPWFFFISLLFFDYAYFAITVYSDYKQGMITLPNIRKAISIHGFLFK
jgi:hypothetical protein